MNAFMGKRFDMSMEDRLYSPKKLGKDADGKLKVTPVAKTTEEPAPKPKDAGPNEKSEGNAQQRTAILPLHIRHQHERRETKHKHIHEHHTLHHKHQVEQSYHDNANAGSKKELHARHEGELDAMHTRHETETAELYKKHESELGKGK